MKVKLRDIDPNPHRDLEQFPFEPAKLDQLVKSIEETGFWDNLVGRKMPGGRVQIAYGHHRIEAVRQVRGEGAEIEMSIRDLDDVQMLKMMAHENHEVYRGSARQDIEIVLAALKAIAAGVIELPAPSERTPAAHLDDVANYGLDVLQGSKNIFTASDIARLLGWELTNEQPNINKVRAALDAIRDLADGIIDASVVTDPALAPNQVRRISRAAEEAIKEERTDRIAAEAASRRAEREEADRRAKEAEARRRAAEAERRAQQKADAEAREAADRARRAAEEAYRRAREAETRRQAAAEAERKAREAEDAVKHKARAAAQEARLAMKAGKAPPRQPKPPVMRDIEEAIEATRRSFADRFLPDYDRALFAKIAEFRPHWRHAHPKVREDFCKSLRLLQRRIDAILTWAERETDTDTDEPALMLEDSHG